MQDGDPVGAAVHSGFERRRDSHLFGPGPKRILALNGGGVRGAITLAFLEEIEATIERIEGRAVRLCDWFDLIAGTSTGAIIASALALGYRAAEVRALYERIAPRIFRHSPFRILGLQAKFDAKALRTELAAVIGDRRLDTTDLQTGLCLVLKRMDTGSSWILANNPRSTYWDTPADRSFIGNRHLDLAKIVRASTAAPHYFAPELIEVVAGMPGGLFLDGGLTPHNNPSLAALMVAHLPAYGLNWALGPDQLTVVSIGTGSFRPQLSVRQARRSGAIGLAVKALAAQIADAELLTLTLMTWLGASPVPWPINSEIGDLGPIIPPFGHLFRFLRYDIQLEQRWLKEHLDCDLDPVEIARLHRMDDSANIPRVYTLGQRAAARLIKREHWEATGS
ncbi:MULTISPECIES: patatin-like phospholipase family protein [unclassified Methylobacterium]|uniref:patatin-like phospholipase family protein n=1 Tax=unclassified Methylobacterium TaxID=2615210 RepID=UPI002269A302|nr:MULTISPECIES: patatin-like phospholipase family protein [unclassified Methylobacterium]